MTEQVSAVSIIAFGASAGGLQSLRLILKGLVPNGGNAYLIAQHLSSTQRTNLAELLAAECGMPVEYATHGESVQPDRVYICPPGHDIELNGDIVVLSRPEPDAYIAPSVNRLFASLARERREQAVAVVLSGAGHDGLAGARDIDGAGGIVIAQTPDEAVQPSMPLAVINDGVVDLIGGAEDIADWLNEGEQLRERLPSSEGGTRKLFDDLLGLVAEAKGMDLRQYKESTLHRQVVRRYQSLGIDSLKSYYDLARKNPDELATLHQAFLISVTAFFRDADVFAALTQILKHELRKLHEGDTFRVWVPGCATGEEAYSIAMVIAELLGDRMSRFDVRIFASDIDHPALDRARSSFFPLKAFEQMSAARRSRWFVSSEGGGRIAKSIRDLVVFSSHDLTSHPPFIRMDLISCRNLLIYFKPEQQADIIRTFHYSLNPGGLLLLGRSESVGAGAKLFEAVNADCKLFRRGAAVSSYPLRTLRFGRAAAVAASFRKGVITPQRQSRVDAALGTLAREFAPAAVLVNSAFEPLHFFGRSQRFFTISEENADFSVFALCLPELRNEIKTLCYRLVQENLSSLAGVMIDVEAEGRRTMIKPSLKRVGGDEPDAELSLLICFEEVANRDSAGGGVDGGSERTGPSTEAAHLREELASAREHLQSVIEELETSNEELQSLNEEVQSSSEELQASNEELQASNEELTTLNDEMRAKSLEVQELNVTLTNIQSSIRISLVVVDQKHRIVRFNSLATRVFGLVSSDMGLVLSRVPCHLQLPDLSVRLDRVIHTHQSEIERVHQGSFHYLMQIDPFRNEFNDVAGAILTFSDISELHRAETAQADIEKRFRRVWESSVEGLAVVDAEGVMVMVNPALEKMFGYEQGELLHRPVDILVPEVLRHKHFNLRKSFHESPQSKQMAPNRDVRGIAKDGRDLFVEVSLSGMQIDCAAFVLATVSDISLRKHAEMALRRKDEQLRFSLEASQAGVWRWDLSTNENWWSEAIWALYGYAREAVEPTFEAWCDAMATGDRERVLAIVSGAVANAGEFEIEWRVNLPAATPVRWLMARGRPELGEDGRPVAYLGLVVDISDRKRMEEALSLWANVFENAEMQIAVGNPTDNTLVAVNPAFARRRGYAPGDMIGLPVMSLFAPDVRADAKAHIRAVDQSGHGVFESEHQTKEGARFPVFLDVTVLKDSTGVPKARVAYALDISERKAADEKLRLAALVFESSSEAIVVADAASRIMAVNPAFTEITGFSEADVLGQPASVLEAQGVEQDGQLGLLARVDASGHWQGEMSGRRKVGESYPAAVLIDSIFNVDGSVHRRIAMLTDITARKNAESEIRRQANYDTLTELPNRRLFHDRLTLELRKAQRENYQTALLFIDLDHFKDVNDTQGHEQGDCLLVEAAQRICLAVRDYDTVARFGGDEFVVILSEVNGGDAVARISEVLIEAFDERFVLGGQDFFVSASIGIAMFPDDANNAVDLVKCADQAMYHAKGEGRRCFRFFTQAMQASIAARARIATELRHAMADEQLQVFYQPIVDLRNGRVGKAEALLRWTHPELGAISPATFIPIAEETGLINAIGDWVFREATRQAKRWRDAYCSNLQISINKSPVQFRSGELINGWASHLDELDLPGNCIVIEITEGLLMHEEHGVLDGLLRFRDMGINVAIDDFGTGYSALSYLKRFDIDYLKIDRSFVSNLSPNSADAALCEAIVVMAHKLGLRVIAEGIETEEQHELLRIMGCDFGQGFLFSKPLPAEAFARLLAVGE